MTKAVSKDISYGLTIEDAKLLSESLADLRIKRMRALNAVAYRKAYGLPITEALQTQVDQVKRAETLRRGLIVSINRCAKRGA